MSDFGGLYQVATKKDRECGLLISSGINLRLLLTSSLRNLKEIEFLM